MTFPVENPPDYEQIKVQICTLARRAAVAPYARADLRRYLDKLHAAWPLSQWPKTSVKAPIHPVHWLALYEQTVALEGWFKCGGGFPSAWTQGGSQQLTPAAWVDRMGKKHLGGEDLPLSCNSRSRI